MAKLRLILGDQLNLQHPWFSDGENAVYTLMEVRSETDYVLHHVQKIVAFFAAMRAYASELQKQGFKVQYLKIDDEDNLQSIPKNLEILAKKHQCSTVELQLPDEYRMHEMLEKWAQSTNLDVQWHDTHHFLSSRTDLKEHFKGKKTYIMESFYRKMRVKYNLLMQPNGQPVGDKWNFDHSNRKNFGPKAEMPPIKFFSRNVEDILQSINDAGVKHFGNINPQQFIWPVTRSESLEMLEWFAENALPQFGTFQDAMHTNNWSLYHSRLSFAMNAKILSPIEVVERCISEWKSRQDEIDIAQIEGFVRQIIGWREYMRGVYWAHMPEYAELNFFQHQKKLPAWFWTGKTKMNCLKHAIGQSLDHAYAHHIQRLMVTGNFALLAGIDPDEVDQWYLGIYIDALEWVEITNTRGMSQFADGGIVGTKPYVSSANYIKKMSNYCKGCHYDSSIRYGEKACPFNSLYWHFYDRNRDKLEKNPRIGMMYRTWDKMNPDEKVKILQHADGLLKSDMAEL
jgi:deoxyribodipyrimidine photolyase-related protein